MSGANDKSGLRGRFITFEGIDGCGKTTQARLLAGRLRELGLAVTETREPGGTPIGEQIRAALLSEGNAVMVPACELLLYLADRVQHLAQVIRPALTRGETVICDRYHDATVAYQHHGRGLALAPLHDFIAAEVLSTPPDLTFWLDVGVAVARDRIARRNREPVPGGEGEGRLDNAQAAFHQRVRDGYAAIRRAEPRRVERIAADGDPESLHREIWTRLEKRFHVL